MKIDAFDIEEFANGEHRGHSVDDLNGESLLLRGGTRTGKTLTFNAILYGLLGASETIDMATGRQNKVELEFTDGTSFFRGNPNAVFNNGEDEFESQEALDRFESWLDDDRLVKSHFVHSHIGKMPLDNLGKDDRISLIRAVTNEALETELRRYKRASVQLEELAVEQRDLLRRSKEELSEVERKIGDLESQLEKQQDLIKKASSGELEKISSKLVAEEELERKLDKLFKRKEGIRKRLRKLNRQKRKQENYSSEVRTIIAEAVNDFVCPACDRRISTEKAKRRLRQKVCPYCGRNHDLSELKESIRGRIDRSEEILETLESEINELLDERKEIEDEIARLQSERPEIENLDGFTKRRLDYHNFNTAQVQAEAEGEVETIQEKLNDLYQEKEDLEEQVEEAQNRLHAYGEGQSHASNRERELRHESFSEEIQSFADAWEEVYLAMSADVGLEIDISESGEIQLPGRNILREYDQGGNLSGSELRLLNLSFVCTLSRFADDRGVDGWQTIVFDEPFDNLSQEVTESALEYIGDAEQQFIITTSTDGIDDYFPNVEVLERDKIQTTIGDFQ